MSDATKQAAFFEESGSSPPSWSSPEVAGGAPAREAGQARRGIRATELYDFGYQDLVSVVPPHTHVLARHTIIPDSRGKTPGRMSDHRWFAYGWDKLHGRELAEEIDQSGANIGLRAQRFPGLNVNADDPDVTLAVLRIAEDVLGPAPHRMSRTTRRLLMYRTEQPFAGRRAAIIHKGKSHGVELLGDGQHFVLLGRHHRGARYTWSRLWRPDELTTIAEADANRFFDALEAQLEPAGFSVHVGRVRAPQNLPHREMGSTDQVALTRGGHHPTSDSINGSCPGGRRGADR